jgi:hypothetical protein
MDALKTIDECHLAALSMDLENRGRQHLAPASYTTLGIRTAQTILYLLGKAAYHRGPAVRPSPGNRTGPWISPSGIAGAPTSRPGSSVTGFEVLAGEQPLPIAAVSRRDSSTIRIELEDAVAVDFSPYATCTAPIPDTSNPVRDNTELRLPLEPFSQSM